MCIINQNITNNVCTSIAHCQLEKDNYLQLGLQNMDTYKIQTS